jgi:hypothetical protein
MSGVNLEALSDEQLDELIAGCRILRRLREPYLQAEQKPLALEDKPSSERSTTCLTPSARQKVYEA